MCMTDAQKIFKQDAIILNLNYELDQIKKELEETKKLISKLRLEKNSS